MKRSFYKTIYLFFCCFIVTFVFLQYSLHQSVGTCNKKQEDDSELVPDIVERRQSGPCVLPHPNTKTFSGPTKRLNCSQQLDVVEVINGTVIVRTPPNSVCTAKDITRYGDFSVRLSPQSVLLKNGMPAHADNFMAECIGPNKKSMYKNVHSTVAFNKELHKRFETRLSAGFDFNVIMIAFDSVSRIKWMHLLPKWTDFFTNTLGGLVLEGYNIVGDGTTPALLAMLAGKYEPELPEVRRGFKGATALDKFPWVWRDYKQAGYVTQYNEDIPSIGAFHMRLLGFRDSPVDHNMRPFYLAEDRFLKHKRNCHENLTKHAQILNVARDATLMYNEKLLISLTFLKVLTHVIAETDDLQFADDDLYEFTRNLYDRGYLDRSVLIAFGDHGPRIRSVNADAQRKLEERLPFMGIRFPPTFAKEYPELMKNLRANVHQLTTPFDVHEMLHHLINVDHKPEHSRGISLLHPIPANRSCEDADILLHWCACLQWENISTNASEVVAAAGAVVSFINNLMESAKGMCQFLSIRRIQSALRFIPNEQMLRFNRTKDKHGRIATFQKTASNLTTVHYQLVLETSPNGGVYEVGIVQNLSDGRFAPNEKTLGRLDRYGNQSACIQTTLPHLAKFCLCNNGI